MVIRTFAMALAAMALCACDAGGGAQAAGSEGREAASPAPASAEEDIRHFLLQEYPDADKIMYALAWSDLDGDGADEAVVYVAGPYFCGSGGCNTLVLTPAGTMWRKVGDISVSRTPVTVLDKASNGWKDLTVEFAGGGIPPGTALLKFDGEAYPGNPTVPPAETTGTKGTVLLAEEPEFKTVEPEAAVEPASAD